MARIRASYSEDHDYSKHPPRGRKRRVGAPPTPFVPGPPPDTSAGFLPKNLSEEQRRELRARQLAASQYVDPDPYSVQAALPDRDLMRRPGDPTDPREVGGYHTLETGPNVGTPFPEIRGPQFTHVNVRGLNEDEIDIPLHPDLSPLQPSDVNASLELIAAVSADDREILAFDNKMSDAHMALRNLRQAAERMVRSVSRQDEKKNKNDSVTAHARNLVRMLSTIIEPWFVVLEQEFEALLGETTQVTEMEGEEA